VSKKIVIIDDDPIHCFILQKYFEELDVSNIKVFGNGKEGIDYLRGTSFEDYPDILFLDLKMPVMDGFEMLRVFEEELWSPSMKLDLIVLTTSLRKEDRMLSNSFLSVTDYITKPVSLDKLRDLTNQKV
jgi:CheY-like chemotaxis protein